MERFIIFLLHLTVYCPLFSQFNEEFTSANLEQWFGDKEDFFVNGEGQLQLMAESEGSSELFTELDFPSAIEWKFDLAMTFSPSDNNYINIILISDSTEADVANGLSLKIGENGADDAISIFQIVNGAPIPIGRGTPGVVADNFSMRFQISRDTAGVWNVTAFDTDTGQIMDEYIFYCETCLSGITGYFGIDCNYTKSRKEHFFLDNITINEWRPDTEGPHIIEANCYESNRVRIKFNERIDRHSARILENYLLDIDQKVPGETIFDENTETHVELVFGEAFKSGEYFPILVQNIKDINGNAMAPEEINLRWVEKVKAGDLLINEILFDPYPDADDFIELVNLAEKFIDINGLIMRNADKNEEVIIDQEWVLSPGDILSIGKNRNALNEIYSPPAHALHLTHDIPSLNNSSGNISLLVEENNSFILLDSLDYTEEMHYSLIKDTEGVSLERISLLSPTNDTNNWFSGSASTFYATPGYGNSVRSVESNEHYGINLETTVVTPDGDGYEDLLILNYEFEKPGYIANIYLLDESGYTLDLIAENHILGTRGIISWDGVFRSGRAAPMGIYVLFYELFHEEGDLRNGTITTVLIP